MKDYHAYVEPESVYHIYNRAHGAEYLFLNDGNYRFFLQGYRQYISPIADTFCYCLMPNHFHLMLRIKVKDHRQFTKLIHYIHFNPVKAGLCSSIEAWEFSSYNSILSKSPSIIDSGEVLEWFDGVQNFLHVHQYPPELTGIHEIES